ncbi:unnamed protein product [Parnassius apollo]|uniref:(apollo) hypothetical protein n=1 Tax=Parnassius apollo TaxID=110799 RepID=A0A8S3XLV7_PARAO|nr:unnamed protein product [Parnassius apollo]
MLKEKLIEEVRKYPLLYDLRDPKYSDVHKKEKAWNEIAIVLSQPVTSVDNTDDGDDENSLSAAEILANVTNNEESQDSSIISERPESSVSMYDSSRSVFPDIPKTTKRKKLQETRTECKKAWALLQDAFRRSIKKRKDTKSGQASIPDKKWKYKDEMSFLLRQRLRRTEYCSVT